MFFIVLMLTGCGEVVGNETGCVPTSSNDYELHNTVDENCDGVIETDADGDGAISVTTGGTDCDDTIAAIHPGAVEVCDDVDNNCDGNIDESSAVDAITWYADEDGDGYGSDVVIVISCHEPGIGFASVGGDCNDADATTNPGVDSDADGYTNCTDCNDADAAINPGAVEVCDNVDNDCDREIDQDAEDGETWFPDKDGDGWGSDYPEDGYVRICAPATDGYTVVNGDCNDADATINPGAVETCDSTIDNDCDGAVGSEDPTCTP